MQDTTGGRGFFFDQVKNYGYINGKLYTDVNQYKNDLGGSYAGVFDTGTSGGATSYNNKPVAQPLDLQKSYDELFKNSGITDTQSQIDAITKDLEARTVAKNTAEAKINDNPFYAEGTRVGRVAKLNDIYNKDVTATTAQQANLQSTIATKKADIETALNIKMKQFDIESQQAQQALANYNNLLSSGALDNADPATIAQITMSTGIPSSAIYSAIDANKAKNVQTSTISYDDGTNQGFAIINTKTGDVISRQVIAPSKPAASTSSGGSGGGTTGSTGNVSASTLSTTAKSALKAVDSNKDKSVSIDEFAAAVSRIMSSLGVNYDSAYNAASQAMGSLGFTTWHWSK